MSNVKFLAIVSTDLLQVSFKDNQTDWSEVEGMPTSLTIYMRGENKDEYIVKKEVISESAINAFLNNGLAYTYASLFGRTLPLDNFYYIQIIADEGLVTQMLSDIVAIGFTYQIAERIYYNTLGVNVPVEDLFTSLTLGMMPQSLELLNTLSSSAVYSYDRENKWRKIYNYLNTIVNDITY
jgi:hypothetical protein